MRVRLILEVRSVNGREHTCEREWLSSEIFAKRRRRRILPYVEEVVRRLRLCLRAILVVSAYIGLE